MLASMSLGMLWNNYTQHNKIEAIKVSNEPEISQLASISVFIFTKKFSLYSSTTWSVLVSGHILYLSLSVAALLQVFKLLILGKFNHISL